jgi:hypothetical protein
MHSKGFWRFGCSGDIVYEDADLCNESLLSTEEGFGIRSCSDLYLLLLNRGSLRLNKIRRVNLARAKELNGLYEQADRDYTSAISMTDTEVSPFWLRSALAKFQLRDLKRVEYRFPDAPEVRAAYATFLAALGASRWKHSESFMRFPVRSKVDSTIPRLLFSNILCFLPTVL